MGNEASQEGGEMMPPGAGGATGPSSAARPPQLITQQSMPLPAGGAQSPTSGPSAPGSRRGSIQLLRRTSSAGVPPLTSTPAPQQQQVPPMQPPAGGSKRNSIVELPPPELDLSNLSEEERATILSVMKRAQSMEEERPPMREEEEPPPPKRRGSVTATTGAESTTRRPESTITCPVCHATDLTTETASQCVECGLNVCKKCSTAIPSGKKHVWMCIRCAENYPQLSPGKTKAVVQEKVPQNSREGDQMNARKQQESNQAQNAIKHQGNIQQQNQSNLPTARGRSGSLTGPQEKQHDLSQHPQSAIQQQQKQQQPKHAQSKQQYPQQTRTQHPPPPPSQQPQQNIPQHPFPHQNMPQHPPPHHQQNLPQSQSPQHLQQNRPQLPPAQQGMPQHPPAQQGMPQHPPPQQGMPQHPLPQQGIPLHPSQHPQQGIPQQQQGVLQQRPPFLQQQPSPQHPQQRPHMQQHPDQQLKLQQQRPYQKPPPPPQQQYSQQNRPQHPQQHQQHPMQIQQQQQQRPQQQLQHHAQQMQSPQKQNLHHQPYPQQQLVNSQHQQQPHPQHHQDFQTQQKIPQKVQQPITEDFPQHAADQQYSPQQNIHPPNEQPHQINQRPQQSRSQPQSQQRNHVQSSNGPAITENINTFPQEPHPSSMVRSKPQESIAAQSLAQTGRNGSQNDNSQNDRPTNNVPKVGTNPFRPDPNPFRNSINHEDALQGIDPTNLDLQDSDPHGKQFNNNLNQALPNADLDRSIKHKKAQGNEDRKEHHESADHSSEMRPPEARPHRRGSLTEMSRQTAEIEAEMRHKEEEQRKNAANVCSESSARRQLPVIDKNRQKKQLPELPQQSQKQNFQQQPQMIEDSQIPTTSTPPTPRARTSIQERHGEIRNGQASIPRTVPLTAATLQQHQQQQQTKHKLPDLQPQHEQTTTGVPPTGHIKQTQQLLQQQIQEQQQRQRFPVQPHQTQSTKSNQQHAPEHYYQDESDKISEDIRRSKERETDVYRSFGVIGQEQQQQHLNKHDLKSQPHQQQQKSDTSHKERAVEASKHTKSTSQKNEKTDFEGREQLLQKYPDEEEDVDDYFKLIENAICVRKPQVILGANKFSEVQKQLLGQESNREASKTPQDNFIQRKGHVANTAKQMDMYNQNNMECNSLTNKPTSQIISGPIKIKSLDNGERGLKQDIQRSHDKETRDSIDDFDDGYVQLKRDSQYIIPPSSTEAYHQISAHEPTRDGPTRSKATDDKNGKPHTGMPYDKLLMHQLTPDTRQPSAKHYLEEHKTQPVSYEAFSSAKAASQQTNRRSSEPLMQVNAYPHAGADIQDEDSKRLMFSLGLINDNLSAHKKAGSNIYYTQPGITTNQIETKLTEPSEAVLNQQNLTVGAKSNAAEIQNQKKAKTKSDPQDWSPVSDLSPIMDVSPSVEAAEQEMMEKFREKTVGEDYEDEDDDLLMDDKDSKMIKSSAGMQGGIPRATSGTISGMLEEFNRAMGLPGTSPVDDSGIKTAVSPTSLAISPISMSGSSMASASALQKEYQDSFPRVSADASQKQQVSPQKVASAPGNREPQPTTPRRTHRRLPQPTVEQMQAAVAIAAQGPRDRTAAAVAALSQHPGSTSAGSTTSSDPSLLSSATIAASSTRPISPMVPWKGSDVIQGLEQNFPGLSHPPQQPQELTSESSHNEMTASIPPKPFPRTVQTSGQTVAKYPENMAALSSASLPSASQNSNLPPQDINNAQARRIRSSSYSSGGSANDVKMGKNPEELLMLRSASNGTGSPAFFNNTAPTEKVSTTEGSPQTPSTPRDKGGDSSDTQSEAESIKSVRLRRKLPSLPADQRSSPSPTRKNLETNKTSPFASEVQEATTVDKPQQNYSTDISASDIVSTSQSVLTSHDIEVGTKQTAHSNAVIITSKSSNSLTELSVSEASVRSLSPSRDIRGVSPSKKHQGSLSPAHYSRSPSPSRAGAVSPGGTKLPQYMQTLKQQLREELKAVTEERKVLMELRKDGPSPGHSATLPSIHRQQLQKRLDEDDITIMTTATTTVVSSTASPLPWGDQKSTLQLQQRTMGLSSSSMHQISVPATNTTQTTSPQQAAGVGFGGNLTPTAAALRRQQLLVRASPQASPKKSRRRHTSEINVPQFSPMNEFYQQERVQLMAKQQQQQQQQLHHHTQLYPSHQYHQPRTLQMQQHQPQMQQQVFTPGGSYKTMEFGALDGHVRPARGTMVALRSSNRYGGSLGSGLSQTDAIYFDRMGQVTKQQIPYYVTDNRQVEEERIMGPDIYFQTLNNEINRLRRSSEAIHQDPIYGGGMSWTSGGGAPDIRMGTSSPQTTERRKKKKEKPRKPSRSWQPSPYVSEDEDDQLSREEKKAKIKAEIARRRQQIEENMRLHDELVKLARRRDRQETATPVGGGVGGSGMQVGTYNKPADLLYSTTPRQTMEMSVGTPLRSASSTLGLNADASSDDTSSVLKAIDEILRKDLYSGGPLARAASGSWTPTYAPSHQEQQTAVMRGPGMYGPQTVPIVQTPSYGGMIGVPQVNYYTIPRTRYEYTTTQEISPSEGYYNTQTIEERSPSRVGEMDRYYEQPAEETSAEDESIERIASTFPTDEPPDILLSATPGPQIQVMQTSGRFHGDLSPITPSDADMMQDHDATPAMPLLPDMPTRSRKLLENLGSSPIQHSRSGSTQSIYQELLEEEQEGHQEGIGDQSVGHRTSEMQSTLMGPSRKSSRTVISKTVQKYNFPVKRILLTRDPKDRSVSGNGLGMKVVGGKEVPGSHGMIGAYVAKIFPGGVVETLGEVKEGDQVLEWNGISLTGRTYEEVQRIIASSADEVEIVIRCDLNMLEAVNHHRNKSPGLGMGGPRLDPPGTPGSNGGRSGGNPSPGPHSPYSPAGSSPRGHSPALTTKRMTGGSTGGGNGGMVTHNDNQHHLNLQQHSEMAHSTLSGSSLSNSASSYDNPLSPERYQSDQNILEYAFIGSENDGTFPNIHPERHTGVVTLFTSSAGLLHHTFSTTSEWPDIYDSGYNQSPDEYVQLHDDREAIGRQVQVACGPRAAIMYVPIIPMRPLVTIKNNGYITQPITERASFARRSLDHIPDYGSLMKAKHPLWPASEVVPVNSRRPLGVEVLNYELLQAKAKVSLHLNSLKENGLAEFPSLTKLHGKNGIRHLSEIEELETRRSEDGSHRPSISSTGERPKAPQDLPGLRPIFVNDWKRTKKTKGEENDDNNNNNNSSNNNNNEAGIKKNGNGNKSSHVGSSPEASSYNFLPKGCRGSFCVIL